MKTIQVSYDLVAPGRNYDRLFGYLKGLGPWAKPLKSLWFVRTTKTPGQVRDEIRAYVDSNDEVLCLDVTDDDWATNFKDASTDWMHSNMSSLWRVA